MNKKDLPVPVEYEQASQRFSIIWNDYVQREEDAKSEFINMVKILESNGYTRTKAIGKIASDHKHLQGFSRMTIYRSLPDDMKRKYESSNIIMLPYNSDVSNDTFENLQEIDAKDTIFSTNDYVNNSDEILDIKTLQERNQFLTKTLEKERYEEYETRIQELKKRNKEQLEEIARFDNKVSDDGDTFAGVFIREYQSKDNYRVQEYEFELLYNEWIIPLKHTTNVTEKKASR